MQLELRARSLRLFLRTFTAPLLALVCAIALLTASFAAPVHKHHANEDSTCLICHVGPTASAVTWSAGAVGPKVTTESALDAEPTPRVKISESEAVRTPRAPPSNSPFV